MKLTPEKLSVKSARIRRARKIIKPILKRAALSRRKILKGTEDAREPMPTPSPKRRRSTTKHHETTTKVKEKILETVNTLRNEPNSRRAEDCTEVVDSKTLLKETSQEFSSGNSQHDAQKFYKAILSDLDLSLLYLVNLVMLWICFIFFNTLTKNFISKRIM